MYELEKKALEFRVDDSMSIIEDMLSLSSNPYLALSFGKDSLVMLDLVRRLKPDVKCLFLKSDETYYMYNYEEVIKKHKGINLQIVSTHRLMENNYDWEKARKAGNKDFMHDDFFAGYDGVFMGLRIDESKGRRFSLLHKENNKIGRFIMQYKTGRREGMYRCCPMAKWKAFEVLLYLKAHNIPFLDVYDQGEHIRTTARITGDAQRQNALTWIKVNNPENWRKLIKMIPELRNL